MAFPEVYDLPADPVKMKFHSLAEGDKKDPAAGKWYKVNFTGKSSDQRFFWSSVEVNAKLKEWGITEGDVMVVQKKEGWNAFHLEYDNKEADCAPPARSGGGKGGYKGGGGNWVKYSPHDLLKTMEWCKANGGDDWKLLFNGCCVSRTFLPPYKAESAQAPKKEEPAEADDDLPFN